MVDYIILYYFTLPWYIATCTVFMQLALYLCNLHCIYATCTVSICSSYSPGTRMVARIEHEAKAKPRPSNYTLAEVRVHGL